MKAMVKYGIIGIFMLMIAGAANAQVIADFEDGTLNGYSVGWGSGAELFNSPDPDGSSLNSLEVALNAAAGGGAITKGNSDAADAKLAVFSIYLTGDVPDGLEIKVFAQDQDWTWSDAKYYSQNIPKDVWYPVYFDFMVANINDPGFSTEEGLLNRLGIEFATGGIADAAWAGSVYMDNVGLIGVQPAIVADFEDGTENGYTVGWGSGMTLTHIGDPSGLSTGVLQVGIDAAAGAGAMTRGSVDAEGMLTAVFYVNLPEGTPDSLELKVFAQDQDWTWSDVKIKAATIPRDVWYPVYFDFIIANINDAGFSIEEGMLNRLGIEVAAGALPEADAAWTGTFLIDNVMLLGTQTGDKYVKAGFESAAGGAQGFINNNWGAALTAVAWAADPTGESNGVLSTSWNFDLGPDTEYKGSFNHTNIDIYDEALDTYASQITMDVYIPADLPLEATLAIFVQDHASWTFTKDTVSYHDFALMRGQWNTLTYTLQPHVDAGEIDPTAVLTVGCEILYYAPNTWTGEVYWDNFTLVGIPAPTGSIASPQVLGTVATTTGLSVYQYFNIQWVDNTVQTSYNVYMSAKAITDLNAAGVVQIADEIPHATQQWIYRPFTRAGGPVTAYFAVTANSPQGETGLISACKTAKLSTTSSSVTAKAVYDADFAGKFVLNGLDNEFVEYAAYKLVPENAGGDESAGWTVESTDLSWETTFVIDDDYLYISADVTDDDLNATGEGPRVDGTQPWMGDALEFFIGYYNSNYLQELHKYNDVDAAGTGDWRIAFTAWGTTGTASSINTAFPGVETTVFQKFAGDGYIIEARLFLDSLALDNNLVVVDGAKLPMQINCNDLDPSNGDEARTLQANWGGTSNVEGWLRPSSWGYLEVLGGPASDVFEAGLPFEFSLGTNYPNPFNPVTHIRYELANRADVTLTIFDMLGKQIRTLVNTSRSAGAYTVTWDGTNDLGMKVSSGIYFYKMTTPEYTKTAKMMLIK